MCDCAAISACLLAEGDVIAEALQSIVWHASDRRPAPIVANNSIERLGLAQWHAASLPFEALVSSSRLRIHLRCAYWRLLWSRNLMLHGTHSDELICRSTWADLTAAAAPVLEQHQVEILRRYVWIKKCAIGGSRMFRIFRRCQKRRLPASLRRSSSACTALALPSSRQAAAPCHAVRQLSQPSLERDAQQACPAATSRYYERLLDFKGWRVCMGPRTISKQMCLCR